MNLRRSYAAPWKYAAARQMRKQMTPAELVFWNAVRARGIGLKFHSQKLIKGWIVDFWCPTLKIAVEIDGGIHNRPDIAARDVIKDRSLEDIGIQVMRFTNEQIMTDLETCLRSIGASPLKIHRTLTRRGEHSRANTERNWQKLTKGKPFYSMKELRRGV